MRQLVVALMFFAGLAACAPETRPDVSARQAGAPSSRAVAEVRWFGALHAIMHEGQTGAAVALASVVPGPHTWGVGALEGLMGEVTILDDQLWLARPRDDGTASLTHGKEPGASETQGAALLVVAQVDAWRALPVPHEVAWTSLDAYLEESLRGAGETLERPVPVRIEGRVQGLRWHVVDGSKLRAGATHDDHARTSVRGELADADVHLVGFFSRAHEGIFTHAGQYAHFHFVSRDGTLSGHVDRVNLAPGATLHLPAR